MLHGFGDAEDHSEAWRILWTISGELLGLTKSVDGKMDPARVEAIRSVVGKLFASKDHTIDSPVERETLDMLTREALAFASAASDQLDAFRKKLAQAESLKLAAGGESVQKPR